MISSFLLQDIPRHDTRLFEVREAFKRTLLLGFRAYICSHIAKKSPPAVLPGPLRGARGGCCGGDAGPLINALVHATHILLYIAYVRGWTHIRLHVYTRSPPIYMYTAAI